MNIPEEAIEKAAEALVQLGGGVIWETPRDASLRKARAALTAAAPHLMAQAWEEGAVAMEGLLTDRGPRTIRNPYMEAL